MKIEHADLILEFICVLGLAIGCIVGLNIVWMLLVVIWNIIAG